MANRRDSLARAASSSGVSPPRRIIPANSLRSITSQAPSARHSSPFAAEETTPTQSAPASRQSWIANTPSPPAAPQISTRSPDWIFAWSISIR